MTTIDRLSVLTTGSNFLYFREQARLSQVPQHKESHEKAAQGYWADLYALSAEVEKTIATTNWQLAHRAATVSPKEWTDEEGYEYDQYKAAERELDRLEYLQDDLEAYLAGRKPDQADPVEAARDDLVRLATRARTLAVSRRRIPNGPRGSYDGEVIQELVKRGIAKEPRHVIHLLNLSEGLVEGWASDELVYWAIKYREARDEGKDKRSSVVAANKALEVGS